MADKENFIEIGETLSGNNRGSQQIALLIVEKNH